MKRFACLISSSFTLGALIAVAGCSGNLSTPAAYYDEVATTYCQYGVDCGLLSARNKDRCVLEYKGLARLSNLIDESVSSGRVIWDSSAAGQCLDSIRNAKACGQNLGTAACRRIGRGAVAVGGTCKLSADCNGGTCSSKVNGCPGTCAAVTDCTVQSSACGALQRCDSQSKMCAPLAGLGASCGSSQDCGAGLACGTMDPADPRSPRICRSLPVAGEPCANFECATDLACDAFQSPPVCIKPVGKGAACTSSTVCMRGLGCIGPKASTTCQSWLDVGQACDPTLGQPAGCASDSKCDPNTNTCVLLEVVADVGTVCTDNNSCRSFSLYCDVVTKTCQHIPSLGESCDPANDHCIQGKCDPSTKKCALVCM